MKKILVLLAFVVASNLYGQYSAPPVTRIAPIDLMGGGIWNWEQRLPMSFDNIIVNGDMSYWPNGTSAPPYGWETGALGEVNCLVSRESSNYKLGQYSVKIKSDGANGYTDVRPTFRKEWRDRAMSLGFWYYCPSSNDREQKVTLYDNHGNSYIILSKDNSWHWAHIVRYIDNEATFVGIRFNINNSSTTDTDDYILIDGLTLQRGRICTEWSLSYWDVLYKYGFYYNGTNYGLKMEPNSNYLLSLYGGIYISKTAPVIGFRESDQIAPYGLWRFAIDSKMFRLDRNTAVSSDFATYHSDMVIDSTGKARFALSNALPITPTEGDIRYKQGASGAPDTLVIYINSKWQKFVGTVNNP